MKIFLLVFVLLGSVSSINMFGLVTLSQKNGASCMDGSPAALYLYQPEKDLAQNKIIIMFQDVYEGWCAKDTLSASIAHCYRYITEDNDKDYGSSTDYPGSMLPLGGILGPNGQFGNWYKVIIKSCDGGSFFGDNQITYKSKTMKFKGYQNVVQAINYLNSLKYLANRDEVVLIGSVNGALATLMWAQNIQSFTKAKVRVISDASITINAKNQKENTQIYQSRLKNIQKMFLKNQYVLPNQKCQNANKNSIWECFYSQNLINYISEDISIYITQSFYDGWGILNVLGYDCAQIFGSLSQCQKQHRGIIDVYYKNVTTTLTQLIQKKNVNAFGIACVSHQFLGGRYNNEEFEVPMNSNNTVQFLITSWIKSKGQGNWTRMDSVQWPHNTPCARKLAGPYLQVTA